MFAALSAVLMTISVSALFADSSWDYLAGVCTLAISKPKSSVLCLWDKKTVTSCKTVSETHNSHGLMIDEHQQVLDVDFEPIEGLYATGNCSGGRFDSQYTTSLPGQSITWYCDIGA